MEYASLFYIISILDNLHKFFRSMDTVFGFLTIITGMAWVISFIWYNHEYSEAFEKAERQMVKENKSMDGVKIVVPANCINVKYASKVGFITFMILMILAGLTEALLPTKKDAVLIVAGIGVVEAVKSDPVKSVASKSVQVVENWLEKQVAETGLEAGEAVKKAAKEAVKDGKNAVNDTAKNLVDKAVK